MPRSCLGWRSRLPRPRARRLRSSRLDDLELPLRPVAPGQQASADDGPWIWDQLMESDGLIVSSPIYGRTISGKLKLVIDRLSGPAADVVFAERYRQMLQAGETPPVALPLRRARVPAEGGRPDRGRRGAYDRMAVAGAAADAPADVLGADRDRRPAARGRRGHAALGRPRRRGGRRRATGWPQRRQPAWAAVRAGRVPRRAGDLPALPSVGGDESTATRSSARPAAPAGDSSSRAVPRSCASTTQTRSSGRS